MAEHNPADPHAGTSTSFGIAGLQLALTSGDNLDALSAEIAGVARRFPWVRMILAGELCGFGAGLDHAQCMPGDAEQHLCRVAAEHGLWLIPGSLYELRDGAVHNTTPVINPRGEVVARYRKIFPFQPYERSIEAGREFVVFDVPGAGRFGISICYDMWFPETTRSLVSLGAEVILHPTMTDTIDRDVELSIARASAAMNQVYFFDINGAGDAGNGRSIIIDPSGYVLHQAGAGAEVMPIEVDFDKVRRERERGLRSNLGQPLKSFRDRDVDFTVYQRDSGVDAYLQTLGPLTKPTR